MIYGVMIGFTYVREASGNLAEYNMWTNSSIDDSMFYDDMI